MMFTGLGPKDALGLPRTFYKSGEIATRRSKTGEPVFWPAPTPLREALALATEHDAITLCANSDGQPWTVDGVLLGGRCACGWKRPVKSNPV